MTPFFELLDVVIDLYMLVVIAHVILSWLVAFDIINSSQNLIKAVRDTVYRLTEPALVIIRKQTDKLNLRNVDVSPIVLLLILYFAKRVIYHYFLA